MGGWRVHSASRVYWQIFPFHFGPVWEDFPRYTPNSCSAAFCWGKVPAWDFVLSWLLQRQCQPDASLSAVTPPRYGWDSVMATCARGPSFLIFFGICLSPSSSPWSPGFSKPALTLPGLHFLLLLYLHPLLFCCLSASLPSLMLLDSQPGPLAGSLLPLRTRFPRNHFLVHLLPKFCYNCWASSSAPKTQLRPLMEFASSKLGEQFWSFLIFFFNHLMGQSYWALPPFQINTHQDYCCSPGQGHQESVSPAVPLFPHPSSCTSQHYH